MKESEILHELEQIAEKLHVKVCHVNLKKYSYNSKSGLCKVDGEYKIIIDTHLHLSEKIYVLVDGLQNFEIHDVQLQPRIKHLFKKRSKEDLLKKAENN